MPLLLTAAVFVLPLACASTSAAPDPPATASRFYDNIRVTAGELVRSIDAPFPTGEFVIPRLGCWPSSGLRSPSASQSFEPTSSSDLRSLDTSQNYKPTLSLASASASKPPPPTFIYDPTTTQPAEPTASKTPTGDPDNKLGEHEQAGAILGLWIPVTISVAVFLGWLCWEVWRDREEMTWLEQHLDSESLLDHGRLWQEDIEAGDVTRR
ncbi:hypothetical protein HBI25_057210 [Parastagonospora nodorum]|nr:hypothetical protein HBH53_055160 [Parastagonospora nodorum]KAH3981785.1 hypothetical protein HBH51_039970 [Parastagonospora nodorum]KAH3983208.1 hypothetical protein HBH52_067560 [Parastagonospora nodorum]KAH4024413.1 hypothetical protein HBI09_160440 [Parastagonospora nodorum]KAH4210306.1 hypothetical protein HBI95_073790 [Parastagonospora nodorum]